MSDFRRFCWAFLLANAVLTVAEIAGVETVYHGFPAVIVQFVVAFSWGVAWVALFGRSDSAA